MNVVVDIGNSRFKSATETDGVLRALPTRPWRDVDVAALIDEVWQPLLDNPPAAVFVCNVAGDGVYPTLRNWCVEHLQLQPTPIRSQAHFAGLTNGYQEPGKLGVDRWAAMVGAHAAYDGALCVIDSGTATTVDLIDASGQHLGGAILPGVSTMRRSLGKYTAALFAASGEDMQPFSDHTAAGISGGTGFASAGAIDRLIDESIARVGTVTSIFTGGEATVVGPILRNSVVIEPQLVLQGVHEIARAATD